MRLVNKRLAVNQEKQSDGDRMHEVSHCDLISAVRSCLCSLVELVSSSVETMLTDLSVPCRCLNVVSPTLMVGITHVV